MNTSLKILLVDDEPDSVQPVKEELETNLPDIQCEIVDFGEASNKIVLWRPDAIVLDLMRNTGSGLINEGSAVGFDVWEKHFCPLIFYTASDENPSDYGHPLVAVIRKGSGSEEQVRERIKTYLPHITALTKVTVEINSALRRALRESRPHIFEIDSAEQQNQLLTRTIRRRVAASMDDAMASGEPNVKSWEQYLSPPSIGHFLTGDIIRVAAGEKGNPESYRVVLTPSCDLVDSGSRKPKVDDVLLARCVSVGRLLKDLGLSVEANAKPKVLDDNRKKPSRFLTQGYGHSSFPIAELPGEFPVMAADFRCLDVVSLKDLKDSDKYDRVASVDAPFRELFVWAYLSAAGRPGMPDRDFEPWADAIIKEVQKTDLYPEKVDK